MNEIIINFNRTSVPAKEYGGTVRVLFVVLQDLVDEDGNIDKKIDKDAKVRNDEQTLVYRLDKMPSQVVLKVPKAIGESWDNGEATKCIYSMVLWDVDWRGSAVADTTKLFEVFPTYHFSHTVSK